VAPTAAPTANPTASAAPTDASPTGGRKLLRASGSSASGSRGGTFGDELEENPWLGYVAITDLEPYVPISDRVVPR
jgi:hypothetical protein